MSERTRSFSGPILGPFQVEFASGAVARADEFRLRYTVFVEERHWLSEDQPLDGQERDEFDDQSCAFLLRDSVTGESAACQRFILPDRLPQGLVAPVERLAGGRGVDFDAISRTSWAEVSRSTVAAKYRWGGRAAAVPAMVAIKYASLALAVALNRTTLFSVSDTRTARLTRRMGFPLHQVGQPFEYHGPRAPFRIEIAEVRASVPLPMRDPIDQLIAAARNAVATPH